MFYRELERYTAALTRLTPAKDGKLHDVAYILEHTPDAPHVELSSELVDRGIEATRLAVSVGDDMIVLNFRISAEYFAVLKSHVTINKVSVHPIRWCDNFEQFTYPLEAHKRTVYEFIRAVVNGF